MIRNSSNKGFIIVASVRTKTLGELKLLSKETAFVKNNSQNTYSVFINVFRYLRCKNGCFSPKEIVKILKSTVFFLLIRSCVLASANQRALSKFSKTSRPVTLFHRNHERTIERKKKLLFSSLWKVQTNHEFCKILTILVHDF